MKIGERIKECREKANYTQTELANMLGINRANVGMWESYRNKPKLEDVVKLSNIFNVSTDYLLGNEKLIKHQEEYDKYSEFFDIYKQLDFTEKAKVMGYAKARLEAQKEIKDLKIRSGYRG